MTRIDYMPDVPADEYLREIGRESDRLAQDRADLDARYPRPKPKPAKRTRKAATK